MSEKESMGITDRLLSLDSRVIYLFFMLALSLPLFISFGFPIPINPGARELYGYIESLPEGSHVMVACRLQYSQWKTEIRPAFKAVMEHLFSKKAKIIFVSTLTETPSLVETGVAMLDKGDAVYGEDYLLLDFVAGDVVAYRNLAEDLHSVAPFDYYGTPKEDLPLLQEISGAVDLDLLISVEAPSGAGALSQFHMTFGTNMGHITVSSNLASTENNRLLGYYHGYCVGMKGGAEYEILTNNLGIGAASTDAFALSNLFLALMVVIPNLVLLIKKFSSGSGE